MTLHASALIGLLVFSVSCSAAEPGAVGTDSHDGAAPVDTGDGVDEDTTGPDTTAPDTTDVPDAVDTADTAEAAPPFDAGPEPCSEVAYHARPLVTRHAPRAVVVFAGTNDIDAGVPVEVVIERARCLRWRIGDALGWQTPVLFIAVTPTPARWSQWPRAQALHAAIAALAEDDPGLVFVDPSPLFLATGEPPAASLFDGDRLHLSPAGYALWTDAIRPALAAHVDPTPPANTPELVLAAGTRVLIDLGPTNPPDGEVAPTPDHLGQHWNHWHPVSGGFQVLAGEQRIDLVTSTGAATGIDLVVAGGFRVNGRRNGGLLWPDAARLGDLAVGSATRDFLVDIAIEAGRFAYLSVLELVVE